MGAFEELNALAERIGPATQVALAAGAEVLKREEVRQIEEIEDAEIPTSSTGRPLWERTGNLPKGVEVTLPGADTAIVDVAGPAAAYAPRRAGLGVDWVPANPSGGIVRLNDFPNDTEQAAGDRAVETVKTTFAQEIGL